MLFPLIKTASKIHPFLRRVLSGRSNAPGLGCICGPSRVHKRQKITSTVPVHAYPMFPKKTRHSTYTSEYSECRSVFKKDYHCMHLKFGPSPGSRGYKIVALSKNALTLRVVLEYSTCTTLALCDHYWNNAKTQPIIPGAFYIKNTTFCRFRTQQPPNYYQILQISNKIHSLEGFKLCAIT